MPLLEMDQHAFLAELCIGLSDERRRALSTLFKTLSMDEKRQFLNHAQFHRCQVQIYNFLLRYFPLSFVKDISPTFVERAQLTGSASIQRAEVTARFLEMCHENGIEVILLKGAAIGASLVDNTAYKQMNDTDILVKKRDVAAVIESLTDAGFSPMARLFDRHEVDLEKNHHLSPYIDKTGQCVIGVHWGLSSPFSAVKPNYHEIWKRKSKVQYDDVPAFVMAPEHNLAHLCFHLPFFKTGIRELADVAMVINQCRIKEKRLRDVIRTWNIGPSFFRVVSLTRELFPLKKEWSWLDESLVEKDPILWEDTTRRLESPEVLKRSRSVIIGKIEKAFALFRTTKNFKERYYALAFMWRTTFFPPRDEVANLMAMTPSQWETLNSRQKVFLRLKLIRKMVYAMSQDYGVTLFWYLTLSNLISFLSDVVCLRFLYREPEIMKSELYLAKERME